MSNIETSPGPPPPNGPTVIRVCARWGLLLAAWALAAPVPFWLILILASLVVNLDAHLPEVILVGILLPLAVFYYGQWRGLRRYLPIHWAWIPVSAALSISTNWSVPISMAGSIANASVASVVGFLVIAVLPMAILGAAQSLFLYRHFERPLRGCAAWVLATVAGYLVGGIVGTFIAAPLGHAIPSWADNDLAVTAAVIVGPAVIVVLAAFGMGLAQGLVLARRWWSLS